MNTVDFLIQRGPKIGEDFLWGFYARGGVLFDFYVFDDKELEQQYSEKI
jgi:hypothetical protein